MGQRSLPPMPNQRPCAGYQTSSCAWLLQSVLSPPPLAQHLFIDGADSVNSSQKDKGDFTVTE